jgi:hypothetical protein
VGARRASGRRTSLGRVLVEGDLEYLGDRERLAVDAALEAQQDAALGVDQELVLLGAERQR